MGMRVTKLRIMHEYKQTSGRHLAARSRAIMFEHLLQGLPHDDYVSVLQSGRNIELVQNWTKDVPQAERALRTKLIGGSAAHFSEALLRAAQLFTETPNGNRHLVIVTDGAETPGSKVRYEDAAHRLNEAGITVHIISYAAIGTDELAQRIASTKISGSSGMN